MFENAQAFGLPGVATQAHIWSGGAAQEPLGPWLMMTALGDHKAFRSLYDATSRRMLGQAISILRDRDAAEDALQDAYVRIWSSAHHFNPERGHPLAWMTRVIRNVAIDRLRSKRQAARYLGADESLPEPAMAPEPIDDRLDLIAALDVLPLEQRSTIQMVILQGWTHEEVARREGIPTATTKSRAQRGLRRLRAALEDDNAGSSGHSCRKKATV